MSPATHSEAATALPPFGRRYAEWEAEVTRQRLDRLREVSHRVPGARYLEELTQFSPEAQRLVVMSPEFGHWLFLTRKWLVWNCPESGDPELDELDLQYSWFVLAACIHDGVSSSVEIHVPLLHGQYIPLIGTSAFVKVFPKTNRDCGPVRLIFDQTLGHWVVDTEEKFGFTASEVRHGGQELNRFGVPEGRTGLYRCPSLPAGGTVIGCPVSTYWSACVRRMCGGPNENATVRYSTDLSKAAADIGAAFRLVSDTWPEMGRILQAHARVVVPLESDSVLSYSESSTPGVLFMRARCLNPLWYSELLVHECAHTWLASLTETVPLLVADTDANHSSPWRSDKRPLTGILYATHAFALVTLLLVRQLDRGLVENSVLARRIVFEGRRVHQGFAILSNHAKLTASGHHLLDTLRLLIEQVGQVVASCEQMYGAAVRERVEDIWPTVIRAATPQETHNAW